MRARAFPPAQDAGLQVYALRGARCCAAVFSRLSAARKLPAERNALRP